MMLKNGSGTANIGATDRFFRETMLLICYSSATISKAISSSSDPKHALSILGRLYDTVDSDVDSAVMFGTTTGDIVNILLGNRWPAVERMGVPKELSSPLCWVDDFMIAGRKARTSPEAPYLCVPTPGSGVWWLIGPIKEDTLDAFRAASPPAALMDAEYAEYHARVSASMALALGRDDA